MKRLLLLAVVLVSLPASAGIDDLAVRIAAFHQHYNAFIRAFYGCPKSARDIEECDPRNGIIDYGEFQKAAKAAKKLFPE